MSDFVALIRRLEHCYHFTFFLLLFINDREVFEFDCQFGWGIVGAAGVKVVVWVLVVDVFVLVEVANRRHISLLKVSELLSYRVKPTLFHSQRLKYSILHKGQPLPHTKILLTIEQSVRGYVEPFAGLPFQCQPLT